MTASMETYSGGKSKGGALGTKEGVSAEEGNEFVEAVSEAGVSS